MRATPAAGDDALGLVSARGGVDCPHAAECPGCPLITRPYPEQLDRKRGRIVAATSRYPALETIYVAPVAPAEAVVAYRTRAKLIVGPEGTIGLYGGREHRVVDIPGCLILAPALAAVVTELRALLAAPPAEAAALLLPFTPEGRGALRALDLREVRSPVDPRAPPEFVPVPAVLLTLVLERSRVNRDELAPAGRALRAMLPAVLGIAANLQDSESPQVLGAETLVLDGAARAPDAGPTAYTLASFGSFVQAHRGQAVRVHEQVLAAVRAMVTSGRAPRVLELYGGSGSIALSLSGAGCDVTMVESFAAAAESARLAATAQGFALEVRQGDAAELATRMALAGERFDAVVVNPPRRGLGPAVRDAIARLDPAAVVYVSCDPDTLARDLSHLSQLGWATDRLSPLDMIPLTEEVETVAVVVRHPAPRPRVHHEDDDIIVVEKAAHEPLHPHPEYPTALVPRCLALGMPFSVPVFGLDPGSSGLCMLARDEAAALLWAQAIETTGRLIFLCAAKGVTPGKGAITRPLRDGGRAYPAKTRYRRLAIASGHSVLRIVPEGGRPHQIRRHLAAVSHPLLGDDRYGHHPTNRHFEEKHGLDRTFLHLVRLELTHPRTGQPLLVESPLPGDLRGVLERATGATLLRFLEQKQALGESVTPSAPPSSRQGSEAARESSRAGSAPELDVAPRTVRYPVPPSSED